MKNTISTISLVLVNLKMTSAKERHQIELELTKIIDSENLSRKDAALTYNNRGHVRYLQVNFDGAIEDYDKAISIDPDLAVAYYNRGTVFYRLGMFGNAVADMQQAVRLEAKNGEFIKGLTACLTRKNQVTVK